MRVEEAEARLRTMLREAGIDLERLEPEATWVVFKAFAAESVDETPELDDDMCLYEYGVFDWSDGKGPRFNWSLCRQFSLNNETGEYDHMEQLRFDLFFEVVPEVESLRGEDWSEPDFDQWVANVEADEAFRAVAGKTPIESRVAQEMV